MKAIINGKIYDTETAELIAVGDFLEIYKTKKGNWFKRTKDINGVNYQIEVINAADAKSFVGLHAPDHYDKYFGRAELA